MSDPLRRDIAISLMTIHPELVSNIRTLIAMGETPEQIAAYLDKCGAPNWLQNFVVLIAEEVG